MSRLGRYKFLGVLGLSIMVAGAVLLARMDVDSTSTDATIAMIVFGMGLGTAMPLFMLAVQNAVPYRVMGVSTSTIQFLRSVGGTMGVAIMFSLIQSRYHEGLVTNVPEPVRSRPELGKALGDPQFILNPQAYQQVQSAFSSFGAQGQALFAQTIEGVKASLATAIADAFLVAVFILAASVVIALFMKEVPLRKQHYTPEEELAAAAPAAPSAAFDGMPAHGLPPVAGGAGDQPSAARPAPSPPSFH